MQHIRDKYTSSKGQSPQSDGAHDIICELTWPDACWHGPWPIQITYQRILLHTRVFLVAQEHAYTAKCGNHAVDQAVHVGHGSGS